MDLMKYKYYDTPEGSDLFHKLFYTCKHAAAISVVTATHDVLLYSNPKGYIPIIARYFVHGIPIVGMTAAFTSITFMAANLRKKDDELNYVFGSAAASSVFGAINKSINLGYRMGLVLTLILVLKKYTKLNDMNFFFVKDPMPQCQGGPSFVRNWDWTISKDNVPRNWTRDPNEA